MRRPALPLVLVLSLYPSCFSSSIYVLASTSAASTLRSDLISLISSTSPSSTSFGTSEILLTSTTLSTTGSISDPSTASSLSSAPSLSSSRIAVTPASTALPVEASGHAVPLDIDTILKRRYKSIVGSLSGRSETISAWLASLGSNGKWPDSEVDYTTGCDARRANWPAQEHWQRIVVMAAAWHGGLGGAEQYVKSSVIRVAISRAMDYWFSRDFTNISCLDSGGTTKCPCTNAGNSLWNTNWFSNIILIPGLVGRACILLGDTLIPAQAVSCARMTGRSYDLFDKVINGVGYLTGANTLDVAAIGIDLALLTVNATVLADAYRRIHLELVIRNDIKADGIRADGSFGQHGGILYNGNYGKDYVNAILDVEIEAGGTQYAANAASQAAFATLFEGGRWMIYRNVLTNVLHWDFSALGRFISFPVIDNQATGSIKINLTQVRELGQQWSSSSLVTFADSLSQTTPNANAGGLLGNRMFYANDYMVHRGRNYVSTVKMFSSRTQNTECVNSQNPFGFHLADGALHTYLRGDEYEDIAAAWDWNLIPGTTVDYGGTALTCDRTQLTGLERFVGGTSDGNVGLAVMRYTNPITKTFRFQKVWFFLDDDVQHVMIANVSSTTSAPTYSILDHRRRSGSVATGETTVGTTRVQTLWHGDVGYILPISNATTLSVQVGQKSGSWAAIGTSTEPPYTVDLFSAWLRHISPATPIAYTAFPGTDKDTFLTKSKQIRLQSICNDARISAIFDELRNTAMIVFWDSAGGSISFTPPGKTAVVVSANGNSAIIYNLGSGRVVVSDPSQTLANVKVTIASSTLSIALPQGGLAGSSVTQMI